MTKSETIRRAKLKIVQAARRNVERTLEKGTSKKDRIEVYKDGEYYSRYWNFEDASIGTGVTISSVQRSIKDGVTIRGQWLFKRVEVL